MGPYRPGVWAGDTLYVSGSGGRKADNALDPTIEGQTKQTMENIGRILGAAGLTFKDSVFSNVYYVDPDGPKGPVYGKLNSVYKDSFALGAKPSRASFNVSKLPGTISVGVHLHRHARSQKQGQKGGSRLRWPESSLFERRRNGRRYALHVG